MSLRTIFFIYNNSKTVFSIQCVFTVCQTQTKPELFIVKCRHQRAFKCGKSMTNINACRTVGNNVDIYADIFQ